MRSASTSSATRARIAWATVLAALSIVALLAAEAHGRSARQGVDATSALQGFRWGSVASAAEAVRAWDSMDVFGRRLVVFTGRWPGLSPDEAARVARGVGAGRTDLLDDDTALLVATRLGIVRKLVVVMPPELWRQRVAQSRGVKGVRVEHGCASVPFMAIERVFCLPDAVPRDPEPSLVLVEPSFFADGAGADPLPMDGLVFDLALVAGTDPVATEASRSRARAFASGVQAVVVEVGG